MKHGYKLGIKGLQLTMLAAGLAVMAAGCGDKTAASKENFAQVLKEDYSSTSDCLFDKALPFPMEVGASDAVLSQTRHQLDALTSAGLVTREQSGKGVNRYELTASGREAAGAGRFCYGKREVTSVDTFTAPAEFRGNRFTHVDYHFVEKNSPSWARAQEIRTAFPAVAKAMAEQPVDEATLVLTPDGWVLND